MSSEEGPQAKAAQEAGHDSWEGWIQELEAEKGHPICGEPTTHGALRPCTRRAAWGVDGVEAQGPCRDHTDAAEAERAEVKERYLELVRSGQYTLQGCARKAGVDRSTIDRWADADEDFRAAKEEAETARAQRRMENLGDALYQDALTGNTKGHERVFLMKVYAASIRRRGRTPPLDYDQPDRLELEGSIEVERPREALEEKLGRIAERLDESSPRGDSTDVTEKGNG